MADSRRQIKTGAILGYCNVLVSVLTGFLTVSLLTDRWGQSEYGVFSLASSLIGYMSVMDFGMHDATIRYISVYRSERDAKGQAAYIGMALKIYLLLDLLLLLTGAAGYTLLGRILSSNFTLSEIQLTRRLFCVLLLNMLISLPGAVFEAVDIAYERFVFVKGIQFLKLLSKLGIMLVLVMGGGRSLSVVWLDTVLNTVVLLAEIGYSFFILKLRIDLRGRDRGLFKSILLFSNYMFLASISDQINWKLDGMILAVMMGSKAVAVSAVGMQLVSVFRSAMAVIPGLFLPQVTGMAVRNASEDELTDVMIRIGQIQLLIMGLVAVGFALTGKEFIVLWAGREYVAVYGIFLVLVLALLVPNTQSVGIHILQAKNMHGFRAKVYLGISVLNLFITVILVQYFGVLGAALGTAAALVIGNGVVINWYYWKRVGLNIPKFMKEVYGREFFSILAAGLIAGLFTMRISADSWMVFFLKTMVITLIYIVCMLTTGLPQPFRNLLLSQWRTKQ